MTVEDCGTWDFCPAFHLCMKDGQMTTVCRNYNGNGSFSWRDFFHYVRLETRYPYWKKDTCEFCGATPKKPLQQLCVACWREAIANDPTVKAFFDEIHKEEPK
jgi:hypothetical protein